MTSNCALAVTCARHEDDAGKHLLTRQPDNTTTCPFFIDKNDVQQATPYLRRLDCRGGDAASQ